MEALDLTRHDPEEYQGKFISCNGREYVVGKHLGTGAERVVHQLVNQKSNLCLHVIKVVRQVRPKGFYTEQLASLRSDPELARVIPITLEIDISGGMVELQPYFGPADNQQDAVSGILDEARAALNRKDYKKAVDLYERIMKLNPFHTIAIVNLAAAFHGLGDLGRAWKLAGDVVEIEPNYFLYREALITYAAQYGQIRLALREFSSTKALFQNVFDLDELGAKLFLASGDPHSAQLSAEQAMLSSPEKENLKKSVLEAIVAKTQSSDLLIQARTSIESKDWDAGLQLLQQAHAIYDEDPFLNINLAFALSRSGDSIHAPGLLMGAIPILDEILAPICYANAAFCLIKADMIDSGLKFLEELSFWLKILHRGQLPFHPADLPGVAIWVDEDRLIEEQLSSALALIQKAVGRASADEQIHPDVLGVAEAYRKGAGAT